MAMALGLNAARHLERAGRSGDLPPSLRGIRLRADTSLLTG